MKNPFAIKDDPHRPTPKEALGWRVHRLAISAAWASAMFGYDQAFIGANITSIFQAGCFFGTIIGYYFSESLGRRPQLIGSGFVFIIGAILQLVSDHRVGLMYAGRVLTGLSVGASSACVPVYIAESSPTPIRGRLVGIFEIWLQIAGAVGFWINYGVKRNLPSNRGQWQILVSIQLVFGALLSVSMFFESESPRWLAKNGRLEEAQNVLAKVRKLDPSHECIQTEMFEMQLSLRHEAETVGSGHGIHFWRDHFKEALRPGIRNRVLLAISLKVMQNLTGLQVINYYSPIIFQSIGLSGTSNSLLATGVFGIVKMVATAFTMLLAVDTIGRRPLLIVGSAGSMLCMYYLGAYSKLSNSFDSADVAGSPDAGGYVAIVLVYGFVIFFAISWNGVPWIFASEVFPNRIRALGMMIAMCSTGLVQFSIVYSTPYMISGIKYGMFFFFGACITVALVHLYLFIPETKGISLEHMDFLFEGTIRATAARKEAEREIAEHVRDIDLYPVKPKEEATQVQ